MIQIIKLKTLQHRGYKSDGDRRRAVRQLVRRGFNNFTDYRDTQSRFALQFCKVGDRVLVIHQK